MWPLVVHPPRSVPLVVFLRRVAPELDGVVSHGGKIALNPVGKNEEERGKAVFIRQHVRELDKGPDGHIESVKGVVAVGGKIAVSHDGLRTGCCG